MPCRAFWPRGLWHRAIASLALLGSLTGCQDATTEAPPVTAVTLSPGTATVTAGATLSLTAQLTNAAGQTVTGQTVTWSTSNANVATVSRSGVVTALAAGAARIAASSYGTSATATITVTARPVASVVVTPASVSMQVGLTTPLQARTIDADGATLTGRTVSWSTSNTAVASVSVQGVVTAVAAGAATITATSEGRSAQSAVTVTEAPVSTVTLAPVRDTIAVGATRQLSAVLRDASGATLTGRVLTWSSGNVALATVSSTGLVSAIAPGTATITGTSEGRTGTATIVVLARLASTVILTPATGTLVVGTTQTLLTQVTDEQGNLLTGRPVTYASDAPNVATVSTAGVVSAIAAGTARITAVSEGKTGTATFTVIPVPVATVDITPAAVSVQPGGSVQLIATPRSAAGAALAGRSVTWISGSPAIATVSASGLVTGLTNGTVTILAVIDGVGATATVTVAPVPVATLTLTPSDASLTVGQSAQLTATLRDAAGTVLTGRSITWSSSDESIAFVSSTGLVVTFKTGSARITATAEGISAFIQVTVR